MDFVFTTTQTSNDFVFDSSNDTFTDLTFQGGTYAAGIQGLPGEGVPAGGTTNQALTKIDATDYNTQWATVDKSFVGLSNVDNTSDENKPVSTAQASALVAKAGDTMTGSLLASPTNTHVLGNSTNKWLSANIGSIATISVNSNDITSLLRLSGGTVDNGAVIVLGGGSHATIANKGLMRIASTEVACWTTTGLGIGTTAPTNTLTLSSTSTGIALYNTADQTTNYERVRAFWSADMFSIRNEELGTGTHRNMQIGTKNRVFTINDTPSTNGTFIVGIGTATPTMIGFLANGTLNASSSYQIPVGITPAIDQSGTAGYTALLINPTETKTGSGAKLLIDAQVGGVSKFSIDNTGKITTALSQTYTASNVTTDRSYDANATTLDEVADVLGTLIADLRAVGVVK